MAGLTPTYTSYGENDCEGPFTEESFHAGAGLEEGVSGKRAFDSSYENERDATVLNSRSNNDLKEDDLD